jgi:hypothetical protein
MNEHLVTQSTKVHYHHADKIKLLLDKAVDKRI